MVRSLFFAASTAGLVLLFAQPYAPGPQIQTFFSSVDDSNQPYALYLPKTLEPGRKYPLVMSLHAEGSSGRLNLMRVFGEGNRFADGSVVPLRYFHPVRDVDFIVASPEARGTMGYEGIAEKDVYDVLADVERKYPVDPDRVYLTGISMGGLGALRLALTRPDVWAAVAAVCPLPSESMEPLAANVSNIPVRLFHGDQDPAVPVAASRLWQRRLLDAGVATEYLEYPAVRHNAWDYAYKNGAVFEWFAGIRRTRFPERVRFATDSYRYASAYWVRFDALTPGTEASIDAQQTGNSEVRVETKDVGGFTLALDHAITAITVDGTPLRPKAAATLSFRKQGGRWALGQARSTAKGPGAEGPIAAAVSGRHIYVYGTSGASSADEISFRRKEAETAAQWSTAREHLQLSFAVKADTDVTADDLDRDDVILFGTRETNSLIARFASRLPLALTAGAADFGLLFVAPIGKHYALVSSGLPWWIGAEDAGRQLSAFVPQPYAELATFGDYLLFEGSLAHVVAEGRFDQNWKLPPDAVAKLPDTGVVVVQ